MSARLSEGLGLCGRLNDHSTPAPVPRRACSQATLLIAVFIETRTMHPNLDANGVTNKQVH